MGLGRMRSAAEDVSRMVRDYLARYFMAGTSDGG